MAIPNEDNGSIGFTLDEKPDPFVEIQEEPEEQGRDRWSRKIEFLFACIGFCVGYGNMWRFPYMCFKNGGGAFLIPYLLFLTFGGVPIFFLEQCVGQFTQSEPVHAWNKLCPLLRGIGFASIAVSFLVSVYYNVIMAWSLFYFYHAFKKDIPWVGFHHPWNTPDCYLLNACNPNASGPRLVENSLTSTASIDDYHKTLLDIINCQKSGIQTEIGGLNTGYYSIG
ncbi:sodium- and chloride-dependent taurine transporter-like [Orbicella faveolata]|uniref:sodium- and chloride-dependent taurine transporter-like n=1 Tax=Orbicella faveolata TaxID=48498 RepID=UPI0009E4DE75|nr:sodium- and chloride-dependent taurine transporter-like [Orbicella faveolata]